MSDPEYPRTLADLERRFQSDEACRAYLAALRWPDGFACPSCAGTAAWSTGRGLLLCRGCRRQVSATAGTIFHRSHLPLAVWFRLAWMVTSQKNGASALNLQRMIGIGSYKTAWLCLHKLRRAMVRPGRDRLRGEVEVDEILVGGETPGEGGRTPHAKTLVGVAAEVRGAATGRIRMTCLRDATKPSLHAMVKAMVEPGSVVRTDGWLSYVGLDAIGYRHHRASLTGKPRDAAVVAMPRVHRVASLLRRWLLGVHQGAAEPKHLPYYLDEFTFRFNRRTSKSRGLLFHRLMQQAVQVEPTAYRAVVAPPPIGVGGVK